MENGHQPATHRDIDELRAELQQEMERLRAEFQRDSDELKKAMRDFQAGILKAFDAFSESTGARLTDSESADAMRSSRLSVIECRVREIERNR